MILGKRVQKNKIFIFSLVIITGLFLMALFAPHLVSHDPLKTETENWLTPPGPDNWFGTDRLGRDIYSRVVFGSRISLSIGFISAAIMIFTGTLLGALAGYYGGIVDNLIMRLTDIIIVFPVLFLIITLISLFDSGFIHIILIIGFTGWPVVARLVRAEFMSLRERDFVQAIRSLGASDLRIITRHILPNALGPIVVAATLSVPAAILAEAGLSFLGLGIPAPVPTWGNILREAHGYFRQAWWYAAFPGAFIFVTVMVFNLLGESLKDLLDS